MANPYERAFGSLSGPAADGFAVTPNDSTDLAVNACALYVGTAGDVKITTPLGTTLTFVGVQAGSVLPWAAKRVFATGTTATGIIGAL